MRNGEQPLCFTSSSFLFQTHFFRRICTDFLETLPQDVVSLAIENMPSTFISVPLKIRGQKPHLVDFFGHRFKILRCHSVMRRNFTIQLTKIAFNTNFVRERDLKSYNKGERPSVKYSLRPLGHKTSQFCDSTP